MKNNSKEGIKKAGKEAMFYEKLESKKVKCHLCPNSCIIPEGSRGSCRVRENQEGKLISLVYGKLITSSVDPIEKKPLYHFLPGTETYSIATVGCNLHCIFCQNWEISQAAPEDVPYREFTPEMVVSEAKNKGCESISYTYIEPSMFYEFILDCAKLARKAGLKNIMVTNGYLNPEPVRKLYKYIDAVNVDIKGFTEDFYKKICFAKLKPVLKATELIHKLGVHVETTTLIIPKLNDDMNRIEEMFVWIRDKLGKDTPVHLSRFYPSYKLIDAQPTPEKTLEKAYDLAKRSGLEYVYVGNIMDDKYSHTYCPKCKKLLIKRTPHFTVTENSIKDGKCRFCGKRIEGFFRG